MAQSLSFIELQNFAKIMNNKKLNFLFFLVPLNNSHCQVFPTQSILVLI